MLPSDFCTIDKGAANFPVVTSNTNNPLVEPKIFVTTSIALKLSPVKSTIFYSHKCPKTG